MNKTFVVISFLFFISVFTILPVFGSEDIRVIISEIDDEIFKLALNSTIISTDGKVIGKLEIANAEEIGQIFVLEQKNKKKGLNEIGLDTWIALGGFGIVAGSLIFTILRGTKQQKTHDDLEFSKLLNHFEDKWTNARLDWKNNKDGTYDNCYAMCSKRLSLLDSIAFLTDSKKIDHHMITFFKVYFREGMLYEILIGSIAKEEKGTWRHFSKYVYDNKMTPESVSLLPETFVTNFKKWSKKDRDFTNDYVEETFEFDKQKFESNKQSSNKS